MRTISVGTCSVSEQRNFHRHNQCHTRTKLFFHAPPPHLTGRSCDCVRTQPTHAASIMEPHTWHYEVSRGLLVNLVLTSHRLSSVLAQFEATLRPELIVQVSLRAIQPEFRRGAPLACQ